MSPSIARIRSSLLAVILLAATAHAQAPAARPTLQDFAWLAGHWRIDQGDRQVDEQWMAPAGGLMMGMARNIQGDKMMKGISTPLPGKPVNSVFVRAVNYTDPNGDIFYIASPSKQTETAFKLTSLRDGEAVFENPQHDFPKKIVYARQADGSLLAAIEGPGRDGKPRRVEYPFKRVTP